MYQFHRSRVIGAAFAAVIGVAPVLAISAPVVLAVTPVVTIEVSDPAVWQAIRSRSLFE